MEYALVELPILQVVGIAVRTRNAHGQSQKDIGELWARWYKEKIADRILAKSDDDILCVYYDYEDQDRGWYTCVLGCQVQGPEPDAPTGLLVVTLAASKYRLYVSTGTIPDCVQQTWLQIWQEVDCRSYRADFDRYGPEAFGPGQARVETWLSVEDP